LKYFICKTCNEKIKADKEGFHTTKCNCFPSNYVIENNFTLFKYRNEKIKSECYWLENEIGQAIKVDESLFNMIEAYFDKFWLGEKGLNI
jgi:hypothetical protein